MYTIWERWIEHALLKTSSQKRRASSQLREVRQFGIGSFGHENPTNRKHVRVHMIGQGDAYNKIDQEYDVGPSEWLYEINLCEMFKNEVPFLWMT